MSRLQTKCACFSAAKIGRLTDVLGALDLEAARPKVYPVYQLEAQQVGPLQQTRHARGQWLQESSLEQCSKVTGKQQWGEHEAHLCE